MRELKSIAVSIFLSLLICVSVSRAAAGANYVAPVATARIGERVYSTTLAFGNATPSAVRCEASYTTPGSEETIRATYDVPAASVLVERDTLREAGAIGVVRLDCAEELVVASRIHRSTNGGHTFDAGRVFEAVHPDDPAATRRSLITTTDVVVMEVAGSPSVLTVRARTGPGATPLEQRYELPAFGQQIVNLSTFRDGITPVHLELSLDDARTQIAIAPASTDPVVLSMTQPRPTPLTASATVTTALRDVTSASFKAAPFRDPLTGLVYMRDRWYDPSTGSFVTPDPEGFADSANPYAYCGGDPVNCSDPTGRRSDLADDRRAIAAKRDAEAAADRRAAEAEAMRQANELHRAGTQRMIEWRRLGVDVKADDIVFLTHHGLIGVTASGRIVPNRNSGVVVDQTTGLVLTVTGLKVAAPAISTAFRAGGVRAAAPIVADELAGAAIGINPSLLVNVPRAITNALEAQRVLADLTEQVNAELGRNPSLARAVLSEREYIALTGSSRTAAAQYGNAIERLVAREIANDPVLRQVFRRIGGPNKPDFTAFGRNFDITTETTAQVMRHMKRPNYGQDLIVVTYKRP